MTRFSACLLAIALSSLAPFAAAQSAAPAPAAAEVEQARPRSPAEIAAASPVPVWRRNGLLVEQGGRALYTFTEDLPGQSRCDAPCEALWPPHYAAPDAKPFGPFTLARSRDGRPMWAWQGKPLYRWISDRRRGAAGGDGVAGVWFLVKVPPELQSQVTAYFPMPMPRPGQTRPAPSSPPSAPRTIR
jgi:predicted lipoprotein with Yx(FWY)xxD motif